MKNQNLKNKLAFNKSAVTELNDNSLQEIKGGTSHLLSNFIETIINHSKDTLCHSDVAQN